MGEGSSFTENIRNLALGSGLYHALYRASEYVGGETWGDNSLEHTNLVQQIPEQLRNKPLFRVLLLGSATPTSITQALNGIISWEREGLIAKGKLTVIDLNPQVIKSLNPNLRTSIDFVNGDVQELPFLDETFDLITSDYLLNFIPETQMAKTINGLARLLTPGGVLSATVDTKKRSLISKISGNFFVRNGLTKEQLDTTIPLNCRQLDSQPAKSRGLAKVSEIGSNRLIWGFQKSMS